MTTPLIFFALYNEITSRIALALNLELIGAEAARPTDNPDALDFILRGWAAFVEAAFAWQSMRKSRSACSSERRHLIRDPSRRRAGWQSRSSRRVLDEMADFVQRATLPARKG